MKKQSKSDLDKKCLKLFGEIVRRKGWCEWCGSPYGQLNGHHVVGKKNYWLRFDLRNGCCLCANCHTLRAKSAHEDSQEFMIWFKQSRPDDYEYLLEVKRTHQGPRHLTILDYEQILKELKEVINDIQ
jgi:hypothetical protein